MLKYNGKVLKYSRKSSTDIKKAFIQNLPNRREFIDMGERKVIADAIGKREPVKFLPNDIVELAQRENNRLTQKLVLFGVLSNGLKACAVIGNMDLYFDVLVPMDVTPERFIGILHSHLSEAGLYPVTKRTEVLEFFPAKLYHEYKKKYVRLYFTTLAQRRKSINHLWEQPIDYIPDKTSNVVSINVETANDDLSCLWRFYARNNGIPLCDWCVISNYKLDDDQIFGKKISVSYTFIVDSKDFRAAEPQEIDNICYKKDKSMIMTWDLETFAKKSDGNAPDANKVFTPSGVPADTIEMDSMTFNWYFEKTAFMKICLTALPTPPLEDCLIVQCVDQLDIIHCKALIMERMAPDFVVGFNDGIYDWSFIISRLKGYDLKFNLETYKLLQTRASCLTSTADRLQYGNIKGEDKKVNIKIAADISVDNTFFKAPGYINIDVRTVFRKLYPAAEKSSLAFFLEKNKLGGKEDMPYLTMFKIFKLMREFSTLSASAEYAKILAYVDGLIAEHGGDYKYFEHYPTQSDDSDFDKISGTDIKTKGKLAEFTSDTNETSTYYIERLTLAEMRELITKCDKVVEYCNTDAQSCQNLLKVRNVVADFREMANISYTSMGDAVDRAGGMKVRNLVMARGRHLAFSTRVIRKVKDERKYPGALVIPPVKNLSRDHVIVKRRRRQLRAGKQGAYNIPYEEVNPQSDMFMKILLDELPEFAEIAAQADRQHKSKGSSESESEGEKTKREPIDEGFTSDRPCAGLDASSLYPSLVMVYNISPEMIVIDPEFHAYLEKKGVRMIETKFLYGLPKDSADKKEVISGWIVQHTPHKDANGKYTYEGMGIYPSLLKELFDKRNVFKGHMEVYAKPKEIFDKIFEKQDILKHVAELPVTEQYEFVIRAVSGIVQNANAEYEKSGKKKFFKFKLMDAEETLEFIKERWVSSNGEYHNTNITEFLAEIDFQFTYYNSKQLALKVFMNTFYGETGNNISPFFMIHVAGSITSQGQTNLRRVKEFIEKMGYRVKYGDTDSLYTECPHHLFAEVDRKYESGEISKLEYWTAMIEITMEDLDKLKIIVNKFLEENNGTNMLKFAYEEVLFPYAMVGKKKYIGVPHMGIVRLEVCQLNCPLSVVMKPGSLFIRGLELKKRGGSEFMKINCYMVWKDAFCIENTETLREIVERHMSDIVNNEWADTMFIRSKRYKLPIGDKPGNVSVLKFIERMRYLEVNLPHLGIRVPEVGERFNVIYAKKYPWQYGISGTNKCKTSVGDQMEFYESLKNEEYKKYLESRGIPLDINLDYYMEGEICGQYARFLMYHPDYDDLFEEWMYEDDDAYKEADKRAHGYVKKTLVKYYRENFGEVYPEAGNIFNIFSERIAPLKNNVIQLPDNMNKMATKLHKKFTMTANLKIDDEGAYVIDDKKDVSGKMADTFINDAKKLGQKNITNLTNIITQQLGIPEILIQSKFITMKTYNRYTKFSIFGEFERGIQIRLIEDQKRMHELMREYKQISEADLGTEGRIVEIIKQANNLDAVLSKPIKASDRSTLLRMKKEFQDTIELDFSCIDQIGNVFSEHQVHKAEIIENIWELYYDIAAKYKRLAEINYTKEQYANKYKRATSLSTVTAKLDADDFNAWIESQ
jgi:DNA polymerase elongation subunit (family B)